METSIPPEKDTLSTKPITIETFSPNTALNTPLIENDETLKQVQLFWGQIVLNPGISILNFAAFLLYSTYEGLVFLPVNLLGFPLLTLVYGLSYDEQINYSTFVQIAQLVCSLFYLPLMGYCCDVYGRKTMIIAAVIISCITVGSFPLLTPGLYIPISTLQNMGANVMLIPPLLADYVDYETKGRVAGLKTVITTCAAFGSSFYTANMDLQTNISKQFYEIAILGLIIGLLITLGLKGGLYHKELYVDKKAEEAKRRAVEEIERERQDQLKKIENIDMMIDDENLHAHQVKKRTSIFSIDLNKKNQALELIEAENREGDRPKLMTGFKEALINPWIFAGYVASFLYSGFLSMGNTILINYVVVMTGSQTQTTQAYSLINKQLLVAGVTAIILGFLSDKYNKFKLLIFLILCSITAVLLLLFSPSPYHYMAYIAQIFFGLGMAGLTIFVVQTTSKYPNPKFRASVWAVSSFFTTLGGAFLGILGIYLSKFDFAIPFYMYLTSAGASLIILFVLYIKKRDILDKL